MNAETPAGSEQGAEPVPLEDFVIITGVSGAGRSTAMEAFEDAGYFCVDNLPPEMIGGLVDRASLTSWHRPALTTASSSSTPPIKSS